jgi:hypothetical protein
MAAIRAGDMCILQHYTDLPEKNGWLVEVISDVNVGELFSFMTGESMGIVAYYYILPLPVWYPLPYEDYVVSICATRQQLRKIGDDDVRYVKDEQHERA